MNRLQCIRRIRTQRVPTTTLVGDDRARRWPLTLRAACDVGCVMTHVITPPLHGERHGACDVGCVHCARRVPPDQSPTPACKCSPRRPHRRRWSTRMCLAELGEGVARGARPIRVIDATSSLQEKSLSLAVGHRVLHVFVSTLFSQNTNEKCPPRGDWGAHHWRHALATAAPDRRYRTWYRLRLAVASTTSFTVAPMLTVVTVQLYTAVEGQG